MSLHEKKMVIATDENLLLKDVKEYGRNPFSKKEEKIYRYHNN